MRLTGRVRRMDGGRLPKRARQTEEGGRRRRGRVKHRRKDSLTRDMRTSTTTPFAEERGACVEHASDADEAMNMTRRSPCM